MTTKPNALTVSINHEHMPALLSSEDQFETWLSGSPAEAFALARSFDPAQMRIVVHWLRRGVPPPPRRRTPCQLPVNAGIRK